MSTATPENEIQEITAESPVDNQQAADSDVQLTSADQKVIESLDTERQQPEEGDETPAQAESSTGDETPAEEPDDQPSENDVLTARALAVGLDPRSYGDTAALRDKVDEAESHIFQQGQSVQAEYLRRQQAANDQRLAADEQSRIDSAVRQQLASLGLPAQQPAQPPQVNLEEYDPEVSAAINTALAAQQQVWQSQMGRLQNELQQQTQYLQQQQSSQEQQSRDEHSRSFYQAVEDLGAVELFGDSRNRQPQASESANLGQLYRDAMAYASGLQQNGYAVPSMSDLVQRAYAMSFSDHQQQQTRQQNNEKVLASSARRGGGLSRSVKPTKSFSGDPVDSPTLKEAWAGYMEANGES